MLTSFPKSAAKRLEAYRTAKKSTSGFTLSQPLVVIDIIALLPKTFVLSFSRARASALQKRHFEGQEMASVDGHVKWYLCVEGIAFNPAATYLTQGPMKSGMDCNCYGVMDNDPAARTAGL